MQVEPSSALPLAELKNFVRIHARMHDVKASALDAMLDRIRDASGEGDGTWTGEWSREGERLWKAGKPLDAARYFSLARFPFVDGPPREVAYRRCLEAFQRWVHEQPKVDRVLLRARGADVPVYIAEFADKSVPLLVTMGAIVSVKEQWYPFLKSPMHGFSVLAMDFPGTGECPLPYTEDAWEWVAEILDAGLRRVGIDRCVVVASSFSGPIFARIAVREPRILGIVMPGSPVRHFFTREQWAKVPMTTKLALSAAMRLPLDEVERVLPNFAVPEEELAALKVPVVHITSLRDEVVPVEDGELIGRVVPRGRMVGIDDTHANPVRVKEAGLEMMNAVLDIAGRQRSAIGLLVRGLLKVSGRG